MKKYFFLSFIMLALSLCGLAYSSQAKITHSLPRTLKAQQKKEAILQHGDILHILLPGEEALNRDFVVDPKGRLLLPEVGPIHVAGKPLSKAKKIISRTLGKMYRHLDHLNIMLKERNISVVVLGHVTKPGKTEIPFDSYIQLALSKAETLHKDADTSKIQLHRNHKIVTIDFKDHLQTGKLSNSLKLKSGDVIFVPQKEEISVTGAVQNPGNYPWSKDTSIIKLLTIAGGPGSSADTSRIVISDPQNNNRQIFNLERFIKKGGNLTELPKIKSGNIINVPRLADSTGIFFIKLFLKYSGYF